MGWSLAGNVLECDQRFDLFLLLLFFDPVFLFFFFFFCWREFLTKNGVVG
jgi:hypothetical protein